MNKNQRRMFLVKIGDFSKSCGVPVSVLRFYDSEGLLQPVYIDPYTGYRYYSETQVSVCAQIGALKSCGFTLAKIKKLKNCKDKTTAEKLFSEQKQDLEKMLLCLEETKESFMNNENKSGTVSFPYRENIDIPFENDERVVGKWQIINNDTMPQTQNKEIYLLPNGEGYWCYGGWTKGYLFSDDGVNTCANPYTLEKCDDSVYMTVEFKSYDYWNGGETEKITLKQIDNKSYTIDEISIAENTDMPFINEDRVIGKWVAHDFIKRKSDFSETPTCEDFVPYFKAIEFLPEGECISVFTDDIIKGDEQCWTKGYLLRKYNKTVCRYEIKRVNGKDYLIIEWKSGDYRYGGIPTDYYVFVRS